MELEAKVQAPITVSQYSFSGGMRAVIPSKNILIDHSFETKLIEEKERFVFKGGDIIGKNRRNLRDQLSCGIH